MSQAVSANFNNYVTVAASQTAAVVTVNAGSYLHKLIIQPETTTPGVVTLLDGKGTGVVTVYAYPGGTVDAALLPIVVPIESFCVNGASDEDGWHLTTGANVNVVCVGQLR